MNTRAVKPSDEVAVEALQRATALADGLDRGALNRSNPYERLARPEGPRGVSDEAFDKQEARHPREAPLDHPAPRQQHEAALRLGQLHDELRPILDRYAQSVKSRERLLFPDLPSAVNVRQRFQRMLAKAGVKAWPKLFQNLRASFAIDTVERFPTHTVSGWCGHSLTIQQKAYMIARDSHFKAAMADGSIQFISEFIDAKNNAAVFPLLGSMRDGEIASLAAN